MSDSALVQEVRVLKAQLRALLTFLAKVPIKEGYPLLGPAAWPVYRQTVANRLKKKR
jgi:hypothetical protein